MGKIYMNQSSLTIEVETDIDLTGVTSVKIKYRKPTDVTGEFTGTVADAKGGLIQYDVQENDLDVPGDWVFWGYATFPSGSVAGEPFTITINTEGHE